MTRSDLIKILKRVPKGAIITINGNQTFSITLSQSSENNWTVQIVSQVSEGGGPKAGAEASNVSRQIVEKNS